MASHFTRVGPLLGGHGKKEVSFHLALKGGLFIYLSSLDSRRCRFEENLRNDSVCASHFQTYMIFSIFCRVVDRSVMLGCFSRLQP